MPEELLEQINKLIEEGGLDPDHVQRLFMAEVTMLNRRTLATERQQAKMLEKLDAVLENQISRVALTDKVNKLDKRVSTIEEVQLERVPDLVNLIEQVDELTDIQKRFPSLFWIATYRTKLFILLLTCFVVGILVVGTPWNVYDVRVIILDLIGIDPNLGLTP